MRVISLLGLLAFLPFLTSAQPSLNWLEFYGQVPGEVEFVDEVAFDPEGNSYMIAYVFQPGESDNIHLLKVDDDGNQIFLDSYNGAFNGPDIPHGLFVGSDGSIYVTGRTQVDGSTYSAITIRYSPTGSREWVHVFSGANINASQGNAVTVAPNGDVYVTGFAQGPGTSGRDLLTLRLDSLGNQLDVGLLTQVSGQTDEGYDIVVGSDGNIYTTAFSWSGPTDGYEVLLVKYDSDFNIFWTQHINGTDNSSNEFPVELIVDPFVNIYVLARIQNDATFTDFALYKLDPFNGGVLWSAEFDEDGNQDIPEDMVMDDFGNIFVTGRVRRSVGGGYNDFGVIKYNSSGVQQWVAYYDGPNNLDDDPTGIALGEDMDINVCGESNRDGSNFEFIVVEFDQSGSLEWEYVYDMNVSSKAHGVFLDASGFLRAAGEGEGPGGDQDFMALSFVEVLDVEDGDELPARTELFQNYPNPFNPRTEIGYSLPAGQAGIQGTGHVSLAVFDLLGHEISTLVDQEQSPGSYTVTWDATGMPSGVYFYRLTSGGFVQTKKLVLLR